MDVFRCLFSRGVHFVRFHHDDWRLIFSGMMTGIVLLSMMSVSEAARHLDSVQSETRVSTGRPVREGGSRSLERQTESKELRSRVQDVLHPAADDAAAASSAAAVPKTVSAEDDSIIGTPLASQQQCVDFLLSVNPAPNITVSPQELVSYYYEEGAREGIRPDVAFAQALKETGFFRYGGTVTPDQNNYCGLGTTSSQVKGAYFGSSRCSRSDSASSGLRFDASAEYAGCRSALQTGPVVLRNAYAGALGGSQRALGRSRIYLRAEYFKHFSGDADKVKNRCRVFLHNLHKQKGIWML